MPRTEIEQGTVSGEISDQQGLFNVNNLALDNNASARDIEAFRRLLEVIGLNPDLAQAIADWIDADEEALPGADAELTLQKRREPIVHRPQRTSAGRNRPRLSDLRRVQGSALPGRRPPAAQVDELEVRQLTGVIPG